MDFTNGVFLFYFLPIFLVLHFVIPKKFRKIIDLIASVVFYAWGAGWITFVLLASVSFDFWLTQGINSNKVKSKLFLLSSVLLNSIPFLYYSIYQSSNSLLTIGLSFFTLQKIGYAIDVYRKEGKPFDNFIDYSFYILYFPKLISGPFVKLKEFGVQVHEGVTETIDDFIGGVQRFSFGLAKKVLIANSLATISESAFNNVGDLSVSYCWIGIIAFVLQVFYDFSGYTDMAIGLGRMTGYTLPENFKNPLLSSSVTNFFKSWHITLYEWFKSYLYQPLIHRLSNSLMSLGLIIVIVIMSIWHSFSYNFLVLGLYVGALITFERLGFKKVLDKFGNVISVLYTLFVLLFGWILFQAKSINAFVLYTQNLFGITTNEFDLSIDFKQTFFLLLAIVLVLLPNFNRFTEIKKDLEGKQAEKVQLGLSVFSIVLLFITVSFIVTNKYIPFIYSQF